MKMAVDDMRNRDLEGSFHITTIWIREGDFWKVVFNMDQRIEFMRRSLPSSSDFFNSLCRDRKTDTL